MKKELNVLIAGDESYFQYAPTFMTNFYELHQDYDVHFYAFTDYMSDVHVQNLTRIADFYNQKVTYIQIIDAEFSELASYEAGIERWPKQTYYHMLVAKYLPETVKRIIYFDLDILFFEDIWPIYDMDLQGNYAANFGDWTPPETFTWNQKRLGGFTNSGVLLIDVAAYREHQIDYHFFINVADKLNQEQPIYNKNLLQTPFHFFADQGLMYVALEGHYLYAKRDDVKHGINRIESADFMQHPTRFIHMVNRYGFWAKAHKQTFQTMLSDGFPELNFYYQKFKIKSEIILQDMATFEVMDFYNVQLSKLIGQGGIACEQISFGSTWLESAPMTYETVNDGTDWVRFPFSELLKLKAHHVKLHLEFTLSEDVNGLKLLSFAKNNIGGDSLRIVTYFDVKADEPVVFDTEFEIDLRNREGVAISSGAIAKAGVTLTITSLTVRDI
ncbi:hypothetical protein Hs30E_03500 [Lactococcus hodotermopsidis]|uniref:Glycosyl transferase n=1 Tax=Pseudolactococcus hodotermopsidis TaxID=2709157 RepID=A0A6A0B8R5_9LACT|nr:glycosyltransferase [Lactococcus hodotermopsidis]GFH41799.1 hypothetical protein Hs30E_03500 [Lactococcus hodotermopsidis]